MPDTYSKNVTTSAEEAAKITPRAEFRVFGQGVIDVVKQKMWDAKAVGGIICEYAKIWFNGGLGRVRLLRK